MNNNYVIFSFIALVGVTSLAMQREDLTNETPTPTLQQISSRNLAYFSDPATRTNPVRKACYELGETNSRLGACIAALEQRVEQLEADTQKHTKNQNHVLNRLQSVGQTVADHQSKLNEHDERIKNIDTMLSTAIDEMEKNHSTKACRKQDALQRLLANEGWTKKEDHHLFWGNATIFMGCAWVPMGVYFAKQAYNAYKHPEKFYPDDFYDHISLTATSLGGSALFILIGNHHRSKAHSMREKRIKREHRI